MPITSEEKAILDHVNNVTTKTIPIYVYFALSTTTPDLDLGTGVTEPVDANYARVRKLQADFWSAAADYDSDSEARSHNIENVEFPAANSTYGSAVTYLIEYDALTGGNVRRIWALSSSVTPSTGQVIGINVCEIATSLGRSLGTVDVTLSDVDVE